MIYTGMAKKSISNMSIGNEKLSAARGRPRRWDENMQARFEAGTLQRMTAVQEDGETKVDFVNAAVMREIVRRENKR
jgi:hypothetical protein